MKEKIKETNYLSWIAMIIAIIALCNPHFDVQRISVFKTLVAGNYICLSDVCATTRLVYVYVLDSYNCVQDSHAGIYYESASRGCSDFWSEDKHSGYSPAYVETGCNYDKEFRVESGVCVVAVERNSYQLKWW